MAGERRMLIVGGGPAGMTLGYLLARSGVEVLVLEREPSFSQSGRGDIFTSTALSVFREVGLIDRILALRHNKLTRWEIYYQGHPHSARELGRLPGDFPFFLVLPAVEVLDLIAARAGDLPEFDLRNGAEASGLLEENGAVVGAEFRDAEGVHRTRARLVVGADGWSSTMRDLAKIPLLHEAGRRALELTRVTLPAPADWPETVGRTYLAPGSSVVFYIDREGRAVLTLTLARGMFPAVPDLDSLREALAERLPPAAAAHVRSHLHEPLEVERVEIEPNRAQSCWRPGLLLLGDAAHTVAPYAGAGVALALRDALGAANHLARAFGAGGPTQGVLAAIEADRLPEVAQVESDQDRATRAIFHPSLPARILLSYGGKRRSLDALLGRFDLTAPQLRLEIDG